MWIYCKYVINPFQHHYSILQRHMILQKSAQETFLIIINVENSCAAQYFCGNCDQRQHWTPKKVVAIVCWWITTHYRRSVTFQVIPNPQHHYSVNSHCLQTLMFPTCSLLMHLQSHILVPFLTEHKSNKHTSAQSCCLYFSILIFSTWDRFQFKSQNFKSQICTATFNAYFAFDRQTDAWLAETNTIKECFGCMRLCRANESQTTWSQNHD